MSEEVTIYKCPKCGAGMEGGFLATEQKGGGVLMGGLRCSRILWSADFKMGFLGSPKGEDVSTKNTHKKYVAVPAVRCPNCRVISFTY